MIKTYQTIVDKDFGNCMQAVVASIFETSLNEVPNFIEFDKIETGGAMQKLAKFYESKGLEWCFINRRNRNNDLLKKVTKKDGGINGYFYAHVPSQTFEDGTHAVVIDSDLNIVHDPNPNQLSMKLSPEDVLGFVIVSDLVIGKTGEVFTSNEWNNLSENERDKNIYKQGDKIN